MQVAKLYGIGDLRIEEMPKPEPGEGEVLLRVRAVGICGSDLHYFKEASTGDVAVEEPLILGHEFAAEIAELGPGVEGLQVGQCVAVDPARPCGECEFCLEGNSNLCPNVVFAGSPGVDGAMREYMVYPAEFLYPLPDDLTCADGAVLEPLGVGIHAVDLGKQKVPSTVAVLGCGPVGLLTLQVAKAAGATRLFATEILDYRLQAAKGCGATDLIDAKEQDVVSVIMEATDGRGVDVVYECAGAQETPEEAIQIAKRGGTVVLVGIPSEDVTTFTASAARRKGLTIKMSRRMKEVYHRSIALVEAGLAETRSVVSHHMPLEKADEAMRMLQAYEDGAIKIILEI
jgi:L-iditol 2-dehydrogenase